jgi:hypothetical protein
MKRIHQIYLFLVATLITGNAYAKDVIREHVHLSSLSLIAIFILCGYMSIHYLRLANFKAFGTLAIFSILSIVILFNL